MIRLTRLLFAIVLAMGAATSAHAVLINSTTAAGRDSVIDSNTQLEWLNLEQTYNLTPNQAVATFSDEGFRWATLPELNGLLTSFYDDVYGDFFINNPAEDPADYQLFAANESEEFVNTPTQSQTLSVNLHLEFREHFGFVSFESAGQSGGYYDDGVDDLSQDYWTTSDESANSLLITGFNAITDLSQNGNVSGDTTDGGSNVYGQQLGVFMVREVPEPTSLTLLGLGGLLFGIHFAKRTTT